MCGFLLLTLGLLVVAGPQFAHAAVVFGQLDDFQDGTTMGWSEGDPSLNPPESVLSGGRRGESDKYVRNLSSGGIGAGSRQIMFNRGQWAGDYTTAGVTRISGWAANLGATPLYLRVAVASGATQFGSANPIDLPADGVWRRVSFDLTDSGLTNIQGSASLTAVLSSVTELRLLSAQFGPTFRGDVVAATLAADDLRAMRPEGDANFDGSVDNADLAVARSNLGASSGGTWAQGDFNFDGRVNAIDLALLRRNLAAPPTPASVGLAVVPEPACAGVCLATLLLLRTRRAARDR